MGTGVVPDDPSGKVSRRGTVGISETIGYLASVGRRGRGSRISRAKVASRSPKGGIAE
jgi:hypothetical protein